MSDDMNTKYQQHYTQILNGTLTDTILKSISLQANVKLANEIIAEQDETIGGLKDDIENLKSELESAINEKTLSENTRIAALESNLKAQTENNSRLSGEVNNINRLKAELDSLKSQATNAETFRNQLIKERESHQKTKSDYEAQVDELKKRIEILEAPPKKKKSVKTTTKVVEETLQVEQQPTSDNTIRDGGSF